VTVSGTVTVEPGRILDDDIVVIQDGTGGIAIEAPSAVAASQLERGRIVAVTGVLAAPYGNLELRPRDAGDVTFLGQGGLPDPSTIASSEVGEGVEGQLVSITATITDIDRSSGGAVTLSVRDRDGEARVYLHAGIGDSAPELERDASVRFTGIVGQRASRSGASDGHRVWPRDADDMRVLSRPPQATPRPDDPGGSTPRPDDERPRRVRIADVAPGDVVRITGTVTTKPGLIDSEGRRVTVEDRSGGIIVRLPADGKAPSVGRQITVSGEVGTWYDAPQLEAESAPRVRERRDVKPAVLRRAPTAADESRLVVVVVRIADVARDGDTWRAEASLGAGGALPIAGVAGSGIPATALPEGASATIIGIVRRAHPAATDQRFAVVPRSKDDIRVGASVPGDDEGDDRDGRREGDDGAVGVSGDGGSDGGGSSPEAATFASLADHTDRLVRVGGRLERSEGRRLHLHDGTASGIVRLPDDALEFGASLGVGEVVNVTGTVRDRGPEPPEVVAESLADIQRAASLPDPDEEASLVVAGTDAGPTVGAEPADVGAALGSRSAASGLPMPLIVAVGGLLGLAVVAAAAAVGVVLWRRRAASAETVVTRPTLAGR
jgi:hypothetical protein